MAYLQWLQTLDADLGREHAGEEGQEGGPRLAEPGNPANASGEEPRRQHTARVVHDNRIDRPEEKANEGDGNGAPDERRDEPDDELQTVWMRNIQATKWGETYQTARVAYIRGARRSPSYSSVRLCVAA